MPADYTELIAGSIEGIAEPTEEQATIAAEVETPPAPATEEAPPAAAEAAPAEKPAEEDEESELKKLEADLLAKEPKLSRGRIPVGRHQAVVTRTRNKMQALIDAEVKKYTEAYGRYESPEFKRDFELLQLAYKDHERFYNALLTNPNYQALVDKRLATAREEWQKTSASAGGSVAASGGVSLPTTDPGPRPEPDMMLQDGTGRLIYSPEQQAKLTAWQLATARAEMRGELKPLFEAKEAADAKARQDAGLAQASANVDALLAEARANWPGFAENEKKVLAYAIAPENKGTSIYQAYIKTVVPGLKLTDADLAKRDAENHAKWAKELEAKTPKTTSVKGGAQPVATATPNEGHTSTEDLVLQSIRRISAA